MLCTVLIIRGPNNEYDQQVKGLVEVTEHDDDDPQSHQSAVDMDDDENTAVTNIRCVRRRH